MEGESSFRWEKEEEALPHRSWARCLAGSARLGCPHSLGYSHLHPWNALSLLEDQQPPCMQVQHIGLLDRDSIQGVSVYDMHCILCFAFQANGLQCLVSWAFSIQRMLWLDLWSCKAAHQPDIGYGSQFRQHRVCEWRRMFPQTSLVLMLA